jgi:hypothetical protein
MPSARRTLRPTRQVRLMKVGTSGQPIRKATHKPITMSPAIISSVMGGKRMPSPSPRQINRWATIVPPISAIPSWIEIKTEYWKV